MQQSSHSGRVLLLIPARGGSRGIPGKNLQQVDGVSLVGRAVLTARRFLQELRLPDARVLVDTDSSAIADEGIRWGAEVPFLRPPEFAADTTTTLASTLHLVERLTEDGWKPDTIILLQPTSPLRSWTDVEACWRVFEKGDRESVVSVVAASKPPQLAMHRTVDGVLHWLDAAPPPNARRQDLTPSVAPSGAVYITSLKALCSRSAFVVPDVTIGVEVGEVRSLDVDTPADLLAVRRACLLAAPPAPTRVLSRATPPVEGELVSIEDGALVLRTVAADALPMVMREPHPSHDAAGVLLLPGRDAPGPTCWREALGGVVAFWCDSAASVTRHAIDIGACDMVLVPQDDPAAERLAAALIESSAALRG